MLSDGIIALIRTAVPAIVGTVIAFFIDKGIDINPESQAALAAALIPICISLYYALATYLEREVNPAFGWLLGNPKAPSYENNVDSGESYPEDTEEYTGE